MPVGFLTDEQARRYGSFVGDPTPDQLARHFHLDDADRAFVGEHRGDHNRLGVAVQLGSVRLLGTFLEDPALTPASAVRFSADQLAIAGSAELMVTYIASAGRWRHGPRIRERYGYRLLTDFGITFRLHRFIYALCWTGTDRPSALFDRAVAWLQAAKVILPGVSVLERAVARVRARTHARLHCRLTETLTSEQRARLDLLVTVPENERQSPLDRLRDGGMKLAVASSAPPANRKLVLDGLGWNERFDAVVASEGLRGKPAPDVFLAAAERLGVPPEACIAFEDAVNGVQSAASAGMLVVGVTTNVPAATLASAGARFTIADFVSLPPELDAMLPR